MIRLALGAANLGLSVADAIVGPVLDPLWDLLARTVLPADDHFDVFEDDAPVQVDARGIPTAACPSCGSVFLSVAVQFDPETYEVAFYLLDGSCHFCGSLVTIPTPIDHPTYAQEG